MSKQLTLDFVAADKIREQQQLEDLYKDDPSNYEHDWQYRNNQ